jgi:hypothetical protein
MSGRREKQTARPGASGHIVAKSRKHPRRFGFDSGNMALWSAGRAMKQPPPVIQKPETE